MAEADKGMQEHEAYFDFTCTGKSTCASEDIRLLVLSGRDRSNARAPVGEVPMGRSQRNVPAGVDLGHAGHMVCTDYGRHCWRRKPLRFSDFRWIAVSLLMSVTFLVHMS